MSLPLTYKLNECFLNAFINKRNYYKDKNLKLVFGSLGLNGWFEFGGKSWKLRDFEKRHQKGSISWDAHAWLEDAEGNIYDNVFKNYNDISFCRTGKTLDYVGTLEGKSKTVCEGYGLTYVPADTETQTAIFLSLFPYLKSVEVGLKNGEVKWFEIGENSYIMMPEHYRSLPQKDVFKKMVVRR